MHTRTKTLPDIRLRGGEQSLVILHRVRGENVVVKISPYAEREAFALRLAKKRGVPVPRVHSREGNKLYLDWISGHEPTEAEANSAFIRQLAAAIKKLHSVKSRGIGALERPKTYTTRAWQSLLTKHFEAGLRDLVAGKKLAKKEEGLLREKFTELLMAGTRPFTPALVHGDLHLYNTRVRDTGEVVLLDFTEAFYGDPLFDFAPFKYFCPKLFAKLRKAYGAAPLPGEKEAMRLYTFIHTTEIAAFYTQIGSPTHANHALRILRTYLR